MKKEANSFVYQNNLYPFNFDLFKTASKFFSKNQNQLLAQTIINLENDFFPISGLSPDIIHTFISFCQGEKYQLQRTNISALYRLSIQYEVPSLTNKIEEFVSEYYEDIINSVFTKQNPLTELHEKILSEKLLKFVNDQRLFQIPIHNLYRIVNRYHREYRQKQQNNTQEADEKIIDFIFECFDHIGIESIILFDHISFENCSIKFLNQKIQKYSYLMNFDSSISTKFNKIIIEMNTKMNQSFYEMNKKIDILKKENEKQKEIIKSLNDKSSSLLFINKFNSNTNSNSKNQFIQKVSELLIYLSNYDM